MSKRSGFLFADRGMPKGFTSEVGINTMISVEKLVWNYLPSKGNRKNYSEKKYSYMKCMLKKQLDCFENHDNQFTEVCKGVPENAFKTQFEMYVCQTNLEYLFCYDKMKDCYFNEFDTSGCSLPCKEEKYKVQKIDLNGFGGGIRPNIIQIGITYKTMDVEIHNEVLIQDIYAFVGTVGGSLGLFIGFSYTGFVGQLLDYLMRS